MYRKKGRGWTKHIDFMLLDVLCMQIAFIVSYIWRFGLGNPYIDKDYRILAVVFLFIDFFVEIVSDAFKNVLKRGYLDEFIFTCKHVALVEIITTFFLFTTQMGEIYSRMSYYIMIPIYILVSYSGRVVLKKTIKKRGFVSSKKSLFVIAPEKFLEETLHGLKENGFGYTHIVAAATDADLKDKTICEIPIVANHDGKVKYSATRFGNVLGSAGSVIPLFKRQIANGGPVTVTDKRIIRYFMTIPEASQLVLQSGAIANNGELFVLDMGQPVKIMDLAENMIRLSGVQGIEIIETGLRPGEKLYEELLVKTEELDKTDNSLIFIERDTALSKEEIYRKIDVLRNACDTGDDLIAKEALRSVVPTFKTPEEVNKEIA